MKSLLISLPFILAATFAGAAEYELKLHHFYVKEDVPQKQMLEPWAREVEKLTNNRVKILIVPRMELGGRPKDLVKQASEGRITDLIWTVNTYTGKTFIRSEVFELPFIHTNDPVATNLAMREMFESDLKEDYEKQNLEVMFLHVHQGHAFLSKKDEIRKPEDLKGKLMRVPGRIHAWIAEELDSIRVNSTVMQIHQVLQRNVANTLLMTSNIVGALRLEQYISSLTEGHESTRFANAVLSVSMNKDRWNSLPPEIQSAFRKASDESFLRRIGQVWSDYEKPGIDRLIQYKKKHIVLTEAETKAFEDKLKPVTERWIKEVEKEGVQGRDLVAKAKRLIQKYSNLKDL
ncbi:MAG: TRAP transporter substrate-binding protein DctP [Deltaproteobacteria bacterium]